MRMQLSNFRVISFVWAIVALAFVASLAYVVLSVTQRLPHPSGNFYPIEWYEEKTVLAFQYSTLIILFVTLWSALVTLAVTYFQRRTITRETEDAISKIGLEKSNLMRDLQGQLDRNHALYEDMKAVETYVILSLQSLALAIESRTTDKAVGDLAHAVSCRAKLRSVDDGEKCEAMIHLGYVGFPEDFDEMGRIESTHSNPVVRAAARRAREIWKRWHPDSGK